MSRTDHPRLPGTHRAGHPDSWLFEEGYSEARVVKTTALDERNRRVIREGLADLLADEPVLTVQEDDDAYWQYVWAQDRLVVENHRIMQHLRSWDPRDSSVTNHLLHTA